MGFSKDWDQRYREDTHMSIWPWSDLISYLKRYSKAYGKNFRVLELGCGAGANIPFLKSLGVQYYSLEGSETIVQDLWKRYPEYKDTITVGDFTKSILFSGFFDLIFDRSALTHNDTNFIRSCLKLVHKKLKFDSLFIGIDWFSSIHTEYKGGSGNENDLYTRHDYRTGPFAFTGNVHFSDKEHLLDLFHDFEIIILEHKKIKREIPCDNYLSATWNIVAKKK